MISSSPIWHHTLLSQLSTSTQHLISFTQAHTSFNFLIHLALGQSPTSLSLLKTFIQPQSFPFSIFANPSIPRIYFFSFFSIFNNSLVHFSWYSFLYNISVHPSKPQGITWYIVQLSTLHHSTHTHTVEWAEWKGWRNWPSKMQWSCSAWAHAACATPWRGSSASLGSMRSCTSWIRSLEGRRWRGRSRAWWAADLRFPPCSSVADLWVPQKESWPTTSMGRWSTCLEKQGQSGSFKSNVLSCSMRERERERVLDSPKWSTFYVPRN